MSFKDFNNLIDKKLKVTVFYVDIFIKKLFQLIANLCFIAIDGYTKGNRCQFECHNRGCILFILF